jgi:hypothetical protein
MRNWPAMAVVAIFLLQASVSRAQEAADAVPAYSALEIPVPVEGQLDNPYDPEEIAIAADFFTPSGRTLRVPGFYKVDCDIQWIPRAERLAQVRLLKVFASGDSWRGGHLLSYILDDVRLLRADGTELVLGDFEQEDPRWSATGAPPTLQEQIVHSGSRAMRVDFDDEALKSWPGIALSMTGDDWSRFEQLRFAIYPLTNHSKGTVHAELYAGKDEKLSAAFPVGEGGLRPNAWNAVSWDLTSIGDRKRATPRDEGGFLVRFCPSETGHYSYRAFDEKAPERTLAEGTFEVTASDSPGFVRIADPSDTFLTRDDGTPLVLIGENMCWHTKGGVEDYDRWLPKLAAAGGNYIRVWMGPWALGIEWDELGRYQQDRAGDLDYVLGLCRRLGVTVQLCLDYHGFLRSSGGTWRTSPYSAARGGPCATPRDFMADPEVRRQYAKRLRYVVARYGAYDNLLAWELWNEVTYIDGYDSDLVADWHQEMARYLRAVDPYDHIITTSFGGGPGDEKVWALPEMEFTQNHTYSGLDKAQEVLDWAKHFRGKYGKPFLVGEFGVGGGGGESEQRDPTGLHLHNGAWVGVLSGSMGTAMTWWWDSYVEDGDMYRHLQPVARYATDLPADARPIADERFAVAYADERTPPTYGDVAIAPTQGSWQAAEYNAPRTVKVGPDGTVEGGEHLAKVMHGTRNHPQLHNPVTFQVNYPVAGSFVVGVGAVSGHGGAGLRIGLDGRVLVDESFPDDDDSTNTLEQYNGDYAIAVPAGEHSILVQNPGNDWLHVAYRLERYVPRPAPHLRVIGLEAPGAWWLWAQSRDSTWHREMVKKSPPEPLGPTVVSLSGMADGRYEVRWWDSWTGEVTGPEQVRAEGGALQLRLPELARDVACKIRRR